MLIYDEKHECASPEDMRSLQLSKLKKIVEYAYENVPFYKKKYDAAGVKPGDIKTLKDIERLPFVEKSDLRDNYPYGLAAVDIEDTVRIHASSVSVRTTCLHLCKVVMSWSIVPTTEPL